MALSFSLFSGFCRPSLKSPYSGFASRMREKAEQCKKTEGEVCTRLLVDALSVCLSVGFLSVACFLPLSCFWGGQTHTNKIKQTHFSPYSLPLLLRSHDFTYLVRVGGLSSPGGEVAWTIIILLATATNPQPLLRTCIERMRGNLCDVTYVRTYIVRTRRA